MRQITKITHCKYLQVGLLCLMPLGISSICAAQETAQKSMTAAQMDAEFPIPETKQDSSDSYDLLVLAGKNIDFKDAGPPGAPPVSPQEDLRKQRAFVQKNAKALEMMQEALQKPIVPPTGRDFDNLSVGENDGALRNLARLVMQRNRVAVADEDWDSALNGALDIVQMGVSVGKSVGTLGMFNSASLQNMGRMDMWNWIEHSDARTALQAARRLEELDAAAPTYADIMREEKWSGLLRLKEWLASPDWQKLRQSDAKEIAKKIDNLAEREAFLTMMEALRKTSDRDILRHYTETMDAVVAQFAQPFQLKPATIPAPVDQFSAQFTSLYAGPQKEIAPLPRRAIWEKVRAGNRALLTALALQAFVKDNAHYPEKLDELRGKYLQEVPSDPFGADTPLIYRRKGESYLLYSVGPNGVDDGGVTIKAKDETRTDGLNAEGDLVVGQFK